LTFCRLCVVDASDVTPARGLTIAQLVERTGVAAATLRIWEARHGFPSPSRLPGGHRRYSESDIELVRAVQSGRAEGLSLAAAIRRSLEAGTLIPAPSIFAGLAARRPDLRSITLAKPAMLALTHAIEDEHCAQASGGVLVGSFQRTRFYRQSERRWRELARTATKAVALADFKTLRDPRGGPLEVPLGRAHPLAREWAIVFHAPGASACLAAWEIPQATAPRERERHFEALWSPEPEVARAAIEVAAESIALLAPTIAASLTDALAPAAQSSPELRGAVKQAHRMLAYLGEQRSEG
jgi:DICT domain-containing protein/predicted DNA-binding transcriptional regulator AlpA